MTISLINRIASDTVIDQAYQWLCKRRQEHHHNSDIWDLRWRWSTLKGELQAQLLRGQYRFGPVQIFYKDARRLEYWQAQDALVLKAVSIVLTDILAPKLPKSCSHLLGNGGIKGALRTVRKSLGLHKFVFRSDVKGYYAHINHAYLLKQLAAKFPNDEPLLALIEQHLKRTMISHNGRYDSAQLGIGLGSPLSPLLAALYLEPMDRAMDRAMDKQMQKSGVCYVRFMDDWLVLAPSRWKLRRAITVINQILACLALAQHPDKTFIGRIKRGFSFLGFRLEEQGLAGLAPKTAANARLTLSRLYEQRRRGQGPAAAVTQYQTHFKRWLTGGLMAAGERPEQYPNLPWEKQQLQILPFVRCG